MIIKDNDLVISDRIIFSNTSYQMRNQPNKIYMPFNNNTTATNHFQISAPLSNIRKEKFFLIGVLGDISYLSKKHNGDLVKRFNVPFSSNQLELYEVNFK